MYDGTGDISALSLRSTFIHALRSSPFTFYLPFSSFSFSESRTLVARLDSAAASASCSPDVAPSRPLHCRRDAIADARETSGEIKQHAHALCSLVMAKITIQCIRYVQGLLKCYKMFFPKLDIVKKFFLTKCIVLREKKIINLEF